MFATIPEQVDSDRKRRAGVLQPFMRGHSRGCQQTKSLARLEPSLLGSRAVLILKA